VVDTPLAANTTTFLIPTSFSFSDGRSTVSNVNASSFAFQVITDSIGIIDSWNNQYFSGNVNMFSGTNPAGCIGCSVVDFTSDTVSYFSEVRNQPGTWTLTVSAVPEPTTSAMVLLGLAGVLFGKARASRRLRG